MSQCQFKKHRSFVTGVMTVVALLITILTSRMIVSKINRSQSQNVFSSNFAGNVLSNILVYNDIKISSFNINFQSLLS